MATGGASQGATGNQDLDGLLSGSRWDGTSITYNFPTGAGYYPADYNGANNEPASFVAVSASFQSMVRDALHQYELVANVTFTEVGAGDAANISVARTGNLNGFSGYGYNPGSAARAGDVWFLSSTAQVGDSEVRGRGTWRLVMHELGHALGLKHSQDAGGVANTPMTAAHDYNDYSIMSYRRTLGGSTSDNAPEPFGSPQTPMMYDIAALQTMYGANYGTQGGNSVYTWSPTTGQAFIDGVGQTAPGANRIYGTLWDGGGIDTYDLSNYATDLRLDLRPGESSTFSNDQLAVTDTRDGTRAGGNVFNALLFNGNAASLIENAVGGMGNDLITGNQADNMLMGGAGNDTMLGGVGNDTVFGNQGGDVLFGNQG
ncbi:M10 family metallopeptidase, partial [Methylobacterium trifolii]|uniref:M10 family metallopeptidase n=1 Tax=Methylobacterium trifolii TaxID=1003092 RepID=UPI001EE0EC53